MPVLSFRRLALYGVAALAIAGCGMAGMQQGPPFVPGPAVAPTPVQAAAPACDKSKCDWFCSSMQVCLYEGNKAKCMLVCEERCGDGFFDAVDAAVIACVDQAGPSVDCSYEKGCCEREFTNQLCAE